MKQKTPTYNCTYEQIQNYIKQGYNQAIREATNYSLAVPIMVLRDEFGFGEKRIDKFMTAYMELYNSISEGYLDLKDIIKTINEETGVKIVERNRR